MKPKTIYFVAGEVSADNHGAALMRSLRELDGGLQFVGRGGPQMQEIAGESAIGRIRGGGQFKNWIGEAAVLGLWEVLRKYGYFRGQFQETLREIRESKPDGVVLIDYPGFNLRLARALQRQAPLQKIIYYISPQVWAWNRGRIKRMAYPSTWCSAFSPLKSIPTTRRTCARCLLVIPWSNDCRAGKSTRSVIRI